MAGVARISDSIRGRTTGEHHGHYDEYGNPIHGPGTLTGFISGNCSSNVITNGRQTAHIGSITTEFDNCGPGQGAVAQGLSSVLVNGIPISRLGDSINPHNGSAVITSASGNVFAG